MLHQEGQESTDLGLVPAPPVMSCLTLGRYPSNPCSPISPAYLRDYDEMQVVNIQGNTNRDGNEPGVSCASVLDVAPMGTGHLLRQDDT